MHVPKQVRFIPAMILMLAGLSPIAAQASDAVLTLARAERLALQGNPALAAAGQRAEALAAVPSQVGSLPEPMLALNALNMPVDTFSNTQEPMTQMQVGVSQALPFPGKLSLKAEAASLAAEAAAQDREEMRLLLLRNTRIHWWNLAYLDKALSIIRQNQGLLRNLVRIAETRYKTGKGLQQDVLLAQLELSKLLERELELAAARHGETASLNALLGRPADSVIALPKQENSGMAGVNYNVASLKQQAREHRPLLRAREDEVQAADSRLELADKDYYPDFKLGAAYGFRQGTNPANGQKRADLASLTFSMSVPLYAGRKQDKAVDQRMAEKAGAEFAWRDAANRVDAEIETAASDFSIARDRVHLFEQGVLPQARQTTASMLAGYQVNKVDFLNLVRARLNEFNTDMQYWKQVSALHQAEARLAAAAGYETLNKEGMHHE
jgi:outer membrane protein TolC